MTLLAPPLVFKLIHHSYALIKTNLIDITDLRPYYARS